MSERVAILGGGSWGMAIASLLASQGHDIALWEFDESARRHLRRDRTQTDKLPDFELPRSIEIENSPDQALAGRTIVIMAVPSQFVRTTARAITATWSNITAVVNLAKGIENESLMRMSEVIHEATGCAPDNILTVSGPSHAEEVVRNVPTTVVAAGADTRLVKRVQELFSAPAFRVYASDDLIGVELGGALKNVIAIAVGIADGLAFGDNAKGALVTRGLAEISRLGQAMGARADTFAGLSGLGDLVTTCFSRYSRNRAVGERIGRGEALAEILDSMSMVAEGVATTRSAIDLAKRHSVEMPITELVHQILFDGKAPKEGVSELMGRPLKAEIWN